MREVTVCGLMILIFDTVLSLALLSGLVLLERPGSVGLTGVWVFAAVKWTSLHVFTSILTDRKPEAVLRRLVLLLCLLSPVMETGRSYMETSASSVLGHGPSPNLSLLLLRPVASSLACLIWEKGLCADGKRRNTDSEENARQLLLRMLKYFKPDTFYMIAAFGFLILAVICDTFIPLYQGKVIDMLQGHELHSSFFVAVGQLTLLSLGSAVFTGVRGGIFMCTLARLNKRLKHLLFHSLMQQEVNFFDENESGRLSSRLHADVDRMGRTVALNANVLVRSSVKTCLMLYVMISLSWELTVLTFIEMPLLAIIQNKYNTLSKEMKERLQDCHANNKNLASQVVGMIHTVRSFRAENDELRRYNDAVDQMFVINKRSGVYSTVFGFMRRVVTISIKVLMLIQARNLISSGRLSIGSLVSFLLYQKPMTSNMREMLFCYGDTVSMVGVISKVFGFLDRTPKCQKPGDLAPEKLQGRVVFQDVTFSYPSAPGTNVLKSVSMQLQPGKMTALVGPNGSGKTSCVALLTRLYEPQGGDVLLDGEPLHRYDRKFFHRKVALVSQNPVLFSGTLRYNIEYGLKNCSLEKLEETVKKINAGGFISELENGYDTDIGEGGNKLSGGQKQLAAVLRALVRDPQVVILDEATSKLDVEAEHAVLQEFLSCGRTVLVVAHKLKTVEKADHIVFLENGSVVEEGTHRQLMEKRGRYHRLKEELFAQTD